MQSFLLTCYTIMTGVLEILSNNYHFIFAIFSIFFPLCPKETHSSIRVGLFGLYHAKRSLIAWVVIIPILKSFLLSFYLFIFSCFLYGYSIWDPEGGQNGKFFGPPSHIFIIFFLRTPPHIFFFLFRPPQDLTWNGS